MQHNKTRNCLDTDHGTKGDCPEVFVPELQHAIQCGRLAQTLVQLANNVRWGRLKETQTTFDYASPRHEQQTKNISWSKTS